MMLHFNSFFFLMTLLMISGGFCISRIKHCFFFEIPDNVKIISVTVTQLIGGNHSME